ncbi:MAG: anti-sigma factor, partial [Gemmatimonadaceae bacterium]|nr:anti-sigma factor [Acetobacteraceae bacterium]
ATGLQPPARRPRRRSLSEKIWRSLALWRGTTVVGLAIASTLAALLLSGEQGPPVTLMAALSPPGTAGPAFLIRVGELGQTVVAPLARVNTPLNRSLELWAVNDGSSTPVSLGLMPGGGRIRLRVPVRQGTRLLVSQEPTGGSPTGVPTGPVVLSGVLTGG